LSFFYISFGEATPTGGTLDIKTPLPSLGEGLGVRAKVDLENTLLERKPDFWEKSGFSTTLVLV
jgi:hypothetical protein